MFLAHADADVVGSVVSYRLRSFSLQNSSNDAYGVLATDIQLQGLSIDVAPTPLDQASSGSSGNPILILNRFRCH